SFEDVDGDYRPWKELSAEGKVWQIANNATYYDVPFEPFAQAVRDALADLPAAAREQAALRAAFRSEGELHAVERALPADESTVPPSIPERVSHLLDYTRRLEAQLEKVPQLGVTDAAAGPQTLGLSDLRDDARNTRQNQQQPKGPEREGDLER